MSPPNAYSSPSPTPSDDAAWLRAYMTSHSLSSRSKYYGYSFWAIVVGITLLYSLAHRFELRGGILGAWCNSVLLGRKRVPDCITWVYDRFKCRRIKTRRPVHFPSNGRLLGVLMLSSLVSILAFSGPDYLPPAEKSRQPETVIQKSWWTSAGRTGIMAFALLPLCILFALKGSPFSLFSSKFLVLLHFDKLAWLHRWSAGLLWLLTACHVGSWSVQLVLDEYPGSKQTVLSLVWSYPPFVYGWWGFVFLTLLIILSLKPIRNHHYELFFASHVLLVPPMLLTTSLHHPSMWLWSWCALAVWAAERSWRAARYLHMNYTIDPYRQWHNRLFRRSPFSEYIPLGSAPLLEHPATSTTTPQTTRPRYIPPPGFAHAEIVAGTTVRLTYVSPRDHVWAPGQYFLVNIPSISRFTTHPFTCATSYNSSETPALVFLVRVKSGFTRNLWDQVTYLCSRGLVCSTNDLLHADARPPDSGALLRMNVDGPFGSAERVKWNTYSGAVIVVAGSGVSYGLSILESLCRLIRQRKKRLEQGEWGSFDSTMARARFVWIVQEFGHIQWAASTLCRYMEWGISSELEINIFVTRPKFSPAVGLGTNFEYEPAASQSEPGIMFNNVPTKDTDMTSSSDVRSLYKPGLHGPEDDEMLDTQLEALDLVAFEGDEDVEIPGERRLSERVKRESKIRRTRSQRRLAGSSDFTQATSANAKFNPQLDRVPRPKPVASVCQYIDRRATPTCSPLTQAQRNNSVVSSEELSSYTPSRLAYVTGDRRNTRSFVSTRKHAPKLFKDIERRTGNPKDYQFTTGIPHTSDTPRFRLQMSEVEMNDINVISEFALPGKPKLEHILQEEMDAVKGPIVVACCGPTSLNTMVRECIVSQTDLGSAWRGGGRGHISFVSEEFEY